MTDISILSSLFVAFALVALASNDIGKFFGKWKLPLSTGFLLTGIFAGPYVLGLITEEATNKLRFVDQISLAVIAFAAGRELYLKEIRSRFRSIGYTTLSLVLSTFVVGSLGVFLLASLIPFTSAMGVLPRLAVSLLAGSIMVARSPSAALAIIHELRARGPFTRTVLGVTVLMDVAVIIVFTIAFSVASGLLAERGFGALSALMLVGELVLSVGVGCLAGWLLGFGLLHIPNIGMRNGMIVVVGYALFVGCDFLTEVSSEALTVPLRLEPLLICLVTGFYVTNFTRSRVVFSRVLQRITPLVYVAFFTLVGASLQMDIVATTWHIALVLFGIRLLGLFIGSYVGGTIAGDPPGQTRIAWMAYITQSTVALGLCKGVAGAFPDWGPSFATVMIGLIVFNQLIGPPFFKWCIFRTKEDRVRDDTEPEDSGRNALLLGVEGQSLAFAHMLRECGWEVKLACKDEKIIEDAGDDIFVHPLPKIDRATLLQLEADQADAIVTFLNEKDSLRICELAHKYFDTRILVARVNEHCAHDRLHELGALVVDVKTILLSVLKQAVRSPATASLLLGTDEKLDTLDVVLGNSHIAGMTVRDLRLPLDVALLYVTRDGDTLSSTGHTKLRLGDVITLSGPAEPVEKTAAKLGT